MIRHTLYIKRIIINAINVPELKLYITYIIFSPLSFKHITHQYYVCIIVSECVFLYNYIIFYETSEINVKRTLHTYMDSISGSGSMSIIFLYFYTHIIRRLRIFIFVRYHITHSQFK